MEAGRASACPARATGRPRPTVLPGRHPGHDLRGEDRLAEAASVRPRPRGGEPARARLAARVRSGASSLKRHAPARSSPALGTLLLPAARRCWPRRPQATASHPRCWEWGASGPRGRSSRTWGSARHAARTVRRSWLPDRTTCHQQLTPQRAVRHPESGRVRLLRGSRARRRGPRRGVVVLGCVCRVAISAMASGRAADGRSLRSRRCRPARARSLPSRQRCRRGARHTRAHRRPRCRSPR